MKRRRRKILLVCFLLLIAVLVGGEIFISRRVAARLAETLQSRLDARLDFDHAWFIPPYGMQLRGVRVMRGDDRILAIAKLDVRLDRLPMPHQKIMIRSLDINEPVVRIIPGGFHGIGTPKAAQPKPKLSTLLHMDRLRIEGGQISYEGGAQPMVWRNIDVDINTTQQSDAKYSFAISAGDGAAFSLKSRGDIDVDEALLDISELELRARHDVAHAPQSLPPPVQRFLRENQLNGEVTISLAGKISRSGWSLRELRGNGEFVNAGRIEITGAASGPTHLQGRPWCEAISHDISIQAHDFSFQPPKFPMRFERINGPAAHLVGGVVQFHDLTGTYGNDQIALHAARLDLKQLPVNSFREIDSTVTFGSPPAQYLPGLARLLDTLRPSGPFVIGGEFTIVRGQSPIYALRISSDTGNLNLADGKIALNNIHGDARVTVGSIEVKQTTADVFGGKAAFSGTCNFGQSRACRGSVVLREIDLRKLAELFPEKKSDKLRGRGFVDAKFEGNFTDPVSLSQFYAWGQAEVLDGEFFEMPVLRELFGAIKPARMAVTAGEAATLFEMKDGVVYLRRAAINAPILGLQGGGEIGLDGRIKLEVVAAPLADWREKMKSAKIPIISAVAGEIVGAVEHLLNVATGTLLYQFRVEGTLSAPHVIPVPVPVLTDAGALLFGQMLQQKPGERLVDFLKSEK